MSARDPLVSQSRHGLAAGKICGLGWSQTGLCGQVLRRYVIWPGDGSALPFSDHNHEPTIAACPNVRDDHLLPDRDFVVVLLPLPPPYITAPHAITPAARLTGSLPRCSCAGGLRRELVLNQLRGGGPLRRAGAVAPQERRRGLDHGADPARRAGPQPVLRKCSRPAPFASSSPHKQKVVRRPPSTSIATPACCTTGARCRPPVRFRTSWARCNGRRTA